MLERLGRKNSIMIGFVVVVAATVTLGLTQHIENDNYFLITSIIARFIQGMGDMWVQTSCKRFLKIY
jgi:MFS family permease